ncbi:MAG: response regulator transcription factor [Clostridia bacterium]|nr:response regulator transcription factor [Clostridia bacterium]
MNIAIVDDNRQDVEKIKCLLQECIADEDYEVSEYLATDSFLDAIETKSFDIVFLDIILDKKDGIEIGRILNKKQPDANVIFVSQNPDYFKDVYKVNHSYFLTKELEQDRFKDAVNKAVGIIKRDSLLIDTKMGVYNIRLKDIMCLESNLKHTKIYTLGNSVGEYNIKMKDIEKKLPENLFIRVHQSFIINMDYIKSYDSQNVMLEGELTVPISRTYTKLVREKLACYLGGIV